MDILGEPPRRSKLHCRGMPGASDKIQTSLQTARKDITHAEPERLPHYDCDFITCIAKLYSHRLAGDEAGLGGALRAPDGLTQPA